MPFFLFQLCLIDVSQLTHALCVLMHYANMWISMWEACGHTCFEGIHAQCVYAGMLFCGLADMFNFKRRPCLTYVTCWEPHAGVLVSVCLFLCGLFMFGCYFLMFNLLLCHTRSIEGSTQSCDTRGLFNLNTFNWSQWLMTTVLNRSHLSCTHVSVSPLCRATKISYFLSKKHIQWQSPVSVFSPRPCRI